MLASCVQPVSGMLLPAIKVRTPSSSGVPALYWSKNLYWQFSDWFQSFLAIRPSTMNPRSFAPVWVIVRDISIFVSKIDVLFQAKISSLWPSLQNLSVCRKPAQSVLISSQWRGCMPVWAITTSATAAGKAMSQQLSVRGLPCSTLDAHCQIAKLRWAPWHEAHAESMTQCYELCL